MRRGRSPSPFTKVDRSPASPLGSRSCPQARPYQILLRVLAPHRQPLRGSLDRPSPTGRGRLTIFDRSAATPDNKRGGAVASSKPRRAKPSPRGVSPRCITTGRHICKPSLKARFRAGIGRTSTFATVCTADITSPRCLSGFRQLFCLTKPRLLAPLIAVGSGLTLVRHLRPGARGPRGLPGRRRFEGHQPHQAPPAVHRDRQVATLFLVVCDQRRRIRVRGIDPLRGTAAFIRLQDQIQTRSAN
jgi:hypothetical protein